MADAIFERLKKGFVRPDLAGAYGVGRSFRSWDPLTVERQLAERIGFFINGVLRRAAPALRERFIRERLSNPTPARRTPRSGVGRGAWIKLPLSAGLRKDRGWLQDSVRMTVTAPGTTATKFRGVFTLSSKVGGGRVQYAHVHENSGRMQFGRVTSEEYAKLVDEIKGGVAAIAAQFGATVS